MNERRKIGQRELDADLIEAPREAERDHQRGGERIKRARRVIVNGRGGHCAPLIGVRPQRDKRRYAARQCAHSPVISITGVFGVKPAARDAVRIVSATAAPAASPTAPHFSQIKNTTGSALS